MCRSEYVSNSQLCLQSTALEIEKQRWADVLKPSPTKRPEQKKTLFQRLLGMLS